MQYVALSMAERASITTRLAIAAYNATRARNADPSCRFVYLGSIFSWLRPLLFASLRVSFCLVYTSL